MKKVLSFLAIGAAILIGIILFNTFGFTSNQLKIASLPVVKASTEEVQHLQEAIRFRTISYGDSTQLDSVQFGGFQKFLETTYPLVHATMKKEMVNGYSLLYQWTGSNPELKPVILMAHQDVVPIERGTEKLWSVDPFAGVLKDDFIWGRGTTDDKMNLISILEAAEKLLKENFQPQRTIYLAFGHDEEIGGTGAIATAALLKSRGIEADLILDEGGIVTMDKVPGMKVPVALVGTSEKGYLSLVLSVEKNGGHSSMPDSETSIDILTKAIVKLRENPFKADFSPSTQEFMEIIGPEMPFLEKMVFANQWLFKGVIIGIYEKSPGGNAMVRTTIAPTIIHAGVKDNVIPTLAEATINFRVLPGDDSESVIKRVTETINDQRVKITTQSPPNEPSSVTSAASFGYKTVEKAVRESFSETVVTPFLMIGATDSRHYEGISKDIIKFSPMIDPIGFHGIDERISIEGYEHGLLFFNQLIKTF